MKFILFSLMSALCLSSTQQVLAEDNPCSYRESFLEHNAMLNLGYVTSSQLRKVMDPQTIEEANIYVDECLGAELVAVADQTAVDYDFAPTPKHPEAPKCSYDIGPYITYCEAGRPIETYMGDHQLENGTSSEWCAVIAVFSEEDYAKLLENNATRTTIGGMPVYFVLGHGEPCWN